ncbi:MAG TPA: hypothetical protein VIA81_12985 [Acidimicrobiia bacterium]
MIKSAYLRIYLPEERIPSCDVYPGDQPGRTRRWEPYGFIGESMIEDAWEAEWRGHRFVCPRRPQLRMLEGVLALYRAYETSGRSIIIPEAVARQADDELRALHRRQPGIKSHILTSAWHVPVRWFVAFNPSDRILTTDGPHPVVRYRSSLSDSVGRIEQAVRILNEASVPESIVAELEALSGWLSEFPAEGMVELDYGGVAELFSEADLILDESAAEVWESIEALARDDWNAAGTQYGALMARWAPVYAVTYSN